jgi:hypothetical protein
LRNNKILTIGLIGALSTVSSEIFTQVCKPLGIARYSIYELSSLLITGDKPLIILGLFVSPIIGAVNATLLYYLLKKLKYNNLFTICITSSILMWIVLETIITIFFESKIIPMRPISGHYGHLASAIIFGITEGILFKMFLFKNIRSIE